MAGTTIDAWRGALGELGDRLVEFEANPTVALARTGCLDGTSQAAWVTVEAAVTIAWDTFRVVGALLTEAEGSSPDRTAELLTTSAVPGPNGPCDPTSGMRTAKQAVDDGLALVGRLATAWGETANRVADARAAAQLAGDAATVRAAEAVADLLGSDPLAVHAGDLATVEQQAAAATARRSAAELTEARFEVDLANARSLLAEIQSGTAGAGGELAHAASRVTGIAAVEPVRDLGALAQRLDAIARTATVDLGRAAVQLRDWLPAAEARRAELESALAPARDGLRRRDDGRGLWTALRAKAAARHLDERADVAAALEAAHDALWTAPCDLARADEALAALTAVLREAT